jgi:uncharacterized membrane protein
VPERLSRLSPPLKLLGVSMLAVAVGALLPWASVNGSRIWGVQAREGKFNLVVALLSVAYLMAYAGFGPFRLGRRTFLIPQFLASWSCLVLVFNTDSSHAAAGYFLSALGGIVWLGSAYWEWRRTAPPRPVWTRGSSGQRRH